VKLRMLHVTNGDSAVHRLRKGGITGDFLPWRDVLHDGPVPGDLGTAELAAVRAGFIAERGWEAPEAVARSFAERDATLERAGDYDELVLWFEHDLYDQLQLLQVLDRLGAVRQPQRASLICEAEYLGRMPPARVRQLFASRRLISTVQLALGRSAWQAFTANHPAALEALLRADLSPLPFLTAAVRRLLEEYPSTRDGLSRAERQALEVLAEGAPDLSAAFPAAHHEREDAVYLGDASFAWYVERLSRCRAPLVALDSGAPVVSPRTDQERSAFWKSRAVVTQTGLAVLAGSDDHVRLNGVDRWLGGVHLAGAEAAWRWDGAAGRLRRS
jgi:hypothetical protein